MNTLSLLQKILNSNEGKIFALGVFLLLLYFVLLGAIFFYFQEYYKTIAAMSVSNVIFGRAAGLSIGLAAGLSYEVVVFFNFYIEAVMVFLLYPLFVLSWKRFIDFGFLKSWVESSKSYAAKYHESIHKYGIFGLLLFVWFPFWMTGPIVGCAIGYLMGLRHFITLSVVLVGTLVATVCWAFFLSSLQEWASSFSEYAPWIIVAVIVVLVILTTLYRTLLTKKP
ncbi:MAG: small multi-drug export protein [Campylobacterota bacterium]|nr:small multi-drug export protein [Campylobacterota bacterium]